MKSDVISARRRHRVHIRTASRFLLLVTLAIHVNVSADSPPAGSAVTQTKSLDPIAIMRTRGCSACHVIPGIPEARGTMGPTLKGLGTRKRLVARTLSNNDKNMRRWLKDPKSVKSDTMMPNVGLSDDEIETLVVYFHSL